MFKMDKTRMEETVLEIDAVIFTTQTYGDFIVETEITDFGQYLSRIKDNKGNRVASVIITPPARFYDLETLESDNLKMPTP